MSITFKKTKINTDDISLFYDKNKREDNDKSNKIREIIIYLILNKNIPDEWYFNEKWDNLRNKLNETITKLAEDIEYSSIKYHYKAGRTNNYDYMVQYLDNNNNIIKTIYLEFKYNCCKLNDYPQFLSKAASGFVNNKHYAEFFYDKYLNEIAELYSLEMPDKISYLKHIYNSNYNKLSFFKKLKEKEDDFKKEKKDIVCKSIQDYLENELELNIDEINTNFQSNQKNKIYLLYQNSEFYIDKLSNDELIITNISHINNKNTIILNTMAENTKISMLLRWKNHLGILYPAWQIGIKR